MELVYSIIFLIIGYGFGSFSTGYVVGRMSGHNIQSEGSGNIGTTNALRTMGAKGGALTFAGDLLKAFIPTLLVRFVFCPNMGYSPEMTYLMTLVIGLGVVIGHNFPFYLHFKGGKGIAATAGLVLSFHPTFIPVGVVLFFGAFLLTHYVSLGSLLVYAGIMIQMVVSGQMGLFHTSQGILNEMYIITAFLTIMAYYKHRENIKRLLKGEERKTYLTKKNKEAIK